MLQTHNHAKLNNIDWIVITLLYDFFDIRALTIAEEYDVTKQHVHRIINKTKEEERIMDLTNAIWVRLHKRDLEGLDKRAEDEGRTRSSMIREIVTNDMIRQLKKREDKR